MTVSYSAVSASSFVPLQSVNTLNREPGRGANSWYSAVDSPLDHSVIKVNSSYEILPPFDSRGMTE